MKQYYKPPGAAEIHSMDWMLQTFELNIEGVDICHVGAHTGFDAYIYHGLGAKSIVWLECNPHLKEKFKKIVEEYQAMGHPDKWFSIAAWDKDDEELDFHFYNNFEEGTASVYKPGGIEEKIPTVKYINQSTKVKTITLDSLYKNNNIPLNNLGLLNIDTQGSELKVLQGADSLLKQPSLKYIICELSFEPLYDGGVIGWDIDLFLLNYGFKRIFFRPDAIMSHGDGIYVRYV
jgi:FkbM family methyltransferase